MNMGRSLVLFVRWYWKISKMIQAADTSLDNKVLQAVHCLTVTRFPLGRSDNFAWQQALRLEERYSDDSTTGTYFDNKRRNRLFGADACPRDVGHLRLNVFSHRSFSLKWLVILGWTYFFLPSFFQLKVVGHIGLNVFLSPIFWA